MQTDPSHLEAVQLKSCLLLNSVLGLVAANPKLLYSSMASMKASLNPSAGSPYLVESLKCGAGHIMLCKLSLSHGSRWLIGFDSGFKHSIYYIILLDNELKHKLAHWYLIDANFGHNVLSDHLDSSFGEDERLLQRIFFCRSAICSCTCSLLHS